MFGDSRSLTSSIVSSLLYFPPRAMKGFDSEFDIFSELAFRKLLRRQHRDSETKEAKRTKKTNQSIALAATNTIKTTTAIPTSRAGKVHREDKANCTKATELISNVIII